jgi:type VI secretion system protein ImpL
LPQRPSLAITPDTTLIATARQTLVSVMGLQNSTDTVYQQILDETRVKYPPVSLQLSS